MIRIIITDDHQIVIDGMIALIETIDGLKVTGQANDGVDLIDVLSKSETDVILMDISMPKMDGFESTLMVKEKYPDIKVLMLSMHDSPEFTKKALKAGADGFLLKNTDKDELEEAIKKVMLGEPYYSPLIMQNVMHSMRNKDKEDEVSLTERELEVLRGIAKEMTTKEIAADLHISHHTVESHRKNLLFKLDARGVAGLVKYAIDNNLLE